MKKVFTSLLVSFLCSSVLFAQTPVEPCATDAVMEAFLTQNNLHQQFAAHYEVLYQMAPAEEGNRVLRTLPIVFHVVYNNNSENVSDNAIYATLNTLNEDFRRQNADAVNTRQQFLSIAADAELEFCLATFDPNGNATTGITRTFTSEASWDVNTETDDMKDVNTGGKDAWDPSSYINVWIVDIAPSSQGGQTSGYSRLPAPGVTGEWFDGIVLDYQLAVGSSPRTLGHEMGHYLGLRHTWGNNPGSCNNDDGIADTPNCDGPNYGCSFSAFSCGSTDQIENFMDYSSCENMFTQGQANVMNAAVSNDRSSLLNSTGCNATDYCIPTSVNGTTDGDYVDGVDLNTLSNLNSGAVGGPTYSNYTNLSTSLNTGVEYTITIRSGAWQAGFADHYAAWIDFNQDLDFDDANEKLGEFLSTAPNTTQTINFTVPLSAAPGTTRLRVRGIWDGVGTVDPCFAYSYGETEDYTVNIVPTITPVADFTASATQVFTGQTVDFTDISSNDPTTWSWVFSGSPTLSSMDQNPVGVVYQSQGCFDVVLSASNAAGSDTEIKTCYIEVMEDTSTGIAERNLDQVLSVYPNPTKGLVTVDVPAGTNGDIRVLNLLGEVVLQQRIADTRNQLELSQQPAGVYFLHLQTAEGNVTRKISLTR